MSAGAPPRPRITLQAASRGADVLVVMAGHNGLVAPDLWTAQAIGGWLALTLAGAAWAWWAGREGPARREALT